MAISTSSSFGTVTWTDASQTQCRCPRCGGRDAYPGRFEQEMYYMQRKIWDELKFGNWQYPTRTMIENNSGDKKMNIITYNKLTKEQRILRKGGLIDENGNLNESGRHTLLDMLATDPEIQAKLVTLVKEYKKDQKED